MSRPTDWALLPTEVLATIANVDVAATQRMKPICKSWMTVAKAAKPLKLADLRTDMGVLGHIKNINCSDVRFVALHLDDNDQFGLVAIAATLSVNCRSLESLQLTCTGFSRGLDWLRYLPDGILSLDLDLSDSVGIFDEFEVITRVMQDLSIYFGEVGDFQGSLYSCPSLVRLELVWDEVFGDVPTFSDLELSHCHPSCLLYTNMPKSSFPKVDASRIKACE